MMIFASIVVLIGMIANAMCVFFVIVWWGEPIPESNIGVLHLAACALWTLVSFLALCALKIASKLQD